MRAPVRWEGRLGPAQEQADKQVLSGGVDCASVCSPGLREPGDDVASTAGGQCIIPDVAERFPPVTFIPREPGIWSLDPV